MEEFVRKIVQNAMGDDLIRAKIAFKNYSPTEMNELYFQSGKTPNEILAGYTEWEEKIKNAVKWLDGVT
jgi:hypothetical protein